MIPANETFIIYPNFIENLGLNISFANIRNKSTKKTMQN